MTGPKNADSTDRTTLLEIYKLLVEMADRVSQRRQAANSYYLSVNTAILGASAFLSAFRPSWTGAVTIAVAGIAVSLFWIRNIQTYKDLNSAKFQVITQIEHSLPVKPFGDEWALLDPDGDGKKHRPFHAVEIGVPWIFIVVDAVVIVASIPWPRVASHLVRLIGSS